MSLIEELKRRRIVRVALVYCAAAFAALQAADVLIPALRLPEWIVTGLAAVAVLGLPVAVALAWAFEAPADSGGEVEAGTDRRAAARPGGIRGWVGGRTVAAVAAIVAVGLLAGWYARSAPGEAYTAPEGARMIRFAHVPDSSHFVDFRCCGPLFAVSPDGRRFAYAGGDAGSRAIYVREIDALEARPVPGTDDGASVFFSPDGEWLGYEAGGRILRASVAGGSPEVIVDELPGSLIMPRPLTGAAWTDDDRVVYTTSAAPAGLFEVPSAGGEARRIATAPEGEYFSTPAAVPGTRFVLVTIGPRDPRVAVVDRRSGEVREVASGLHPRYAAGHLVSLQPNGAVVAEPFDARRGRITGPRRTLLSGVFRALGGWGDYDASVNGTLVAQMEEISPSLVIQRRDGLRRSIVLPIPDYHHLDGPRFSPDGERVALAAPIASGHHSVYVLDLESGSTLKVSGDADTEYSDWTPDGSTLLVAADYRSIQRVPADLSGPPRDVVSPVDGTVGKLSVWGDWVVYTLSTPVESGAGAGGVAEALDRDIYMARIDSLDAIRPYVATPGPEYAPSVSPDGRWVAYVSEASGRPEVYVSAFPEAGARTAISAGGGFEPVWGGDSGRLYYRTQIGAAMEARLEEQSGRLRVRDRTPLVADLYELAPDAADWDVAPDDDRIALLGIRRGGRLEVLVNALGGDGPP